MLALVEKMNFPKDPVEVVRLPLHSMGKSSLACLWDPNTKVSMSHLAEALSEAVTALLENALIQLSKLSFKFIQTAAKKLFKAMASLRFAETEGEGSWF